jgi:hypothetical protein
VITGLTVFMIVVYSSSLSLERLAEDVVSEDFRFGQKKHSLHLLFVESFVIVGSVLSPWKVTALKCSSSLFLSSIR